MLEYLLSLLAFDIDYERSYIHYTIYNINVSQYVNKKNSDPVTPPPLPPNYSYWQQLHNYNIEGKKKVCVWGGGGGGRGGEGGRSIKERIYSFFLRNLVSYEASTLYNLRNLIIIQYFGVIFFLV